MFTFTVLTTIGYGDFAPQTTAGRLCFCVYALVSIPVAGVCFGRVASAVVDLASWAPACRRAAIREAFFSAAAAAADDASGSGGGARRINHAAMLRAIAQAQQCAVDVVDYEHLLREADPRGEDSFSLRAFAWVYTHLGTIPQRIAEKRTRVRVTAACFAAWLLIGMGTFARVEGWSAVESLYFCFETLLTIGLGDFVPRTFCPPFAPCLVPFWLVVAAPAC
jgi:hypothetical protein